MIVGKINEKRIQSILKKRSECSVDYAISQIKKSSLEPYISKVYLYGSCARNEGTYISDVDLFIEFKEDFDPDRYRDELNYLRGHISPEDPELPEVDMHTAMGSRWKKETAGYYKDIKNEGVVIWESQR